MPLGRRRSELSRAAKAVNRRMFLKAMALGMSVPAAARLARMATAQTAKPPKRLLVMYIPHGTAARALQSEDRQPNPLVQANYTDFDLDQTNVSILGPLQPYKQYVNVYQGFQYPGKADTHEGIVNCLSGTRRSNHRRAHHLRARDRQGAQRQAADPGGLLAPHLRAGQERHVVLERHGDRSREEPGQGVRQPVRRRRHRAARERGRRSCTRICWRSPRPRCRACRRRCRA